MEAEALEAFLADYERRPWIWGRIDCCLILADWVVVNGYPDVATSLRGAYHGQISCARLVRRSGGLVRLVDGLAAAAGLTRAAHPVPGAVGVVGGQGWRRWGAIHDGHRWCIRIEPGLVRVTTAPLTMWSF